ncbi:hypothetical protein C0585_03995 [Candidatus Woesearchaeota archaeon]|nr:MAG: hypothetical protein C0585_03995 [Candidatus Woesearchaeota archaeon]
MVTILNQDKNIILELKKIGFVEIGTKTQYEISRLVCSNPKATAILYTSKKLLIQASKENEEIILEKLGEKSKEVDKKEKDVFISKTISGIAVGSDETLKGDTFGGLVVAGVLCDDITRQKLKELGVDDSKKISDDMIPFLAEKIRKIANYSVQNIYPEEYNKNSQTELMNKLHRQVYLDLGGKGTHIVDKYPGCRVGDVIETKAEDKYVEVAAASIIARDEGLKQLEELTKKLKFKVPKGSTHVKHALLFLKKSQKNPKDFVKFHFKNVQEVFR